MRKIFLLSVLALSIQFLAVGQGVKNVSEELKSRFLAVPVAQWGWF